MGSPLCLHECEHEMISIQDGLILAEEEEERNRKETGEEVFSGLVIRLPMEGLILLPGHG